MRIPTLMLAKNVLLTRARHIIGGWIPIMDSATRKLLELSASSGRSDVTLTHGSFLQRGGAVVNFKTMELTFKKDNQKLYLRRDPPLKLSASVAAALTPQIEENSSMSTEADGIAFLFVRCCTNSYF